MLQDIYYSRKSNKAVQVITQCRVLPDGTNAICFQELSGDYEVFVMASENFARAFYKRGQYGPFDGDDQKKISQGDIHQKRICQNENTESEEEVPALIRFLDAETYKEKIKILEEMKDELDDRTMNNLAVSLDLSIEDGVDGYSLLMSELRIRSRFEAKRGDRL